MKKLIDYLPAIITFIVLILWQGYNHNYNYFLIIAFLLGAMSKEQSFLKLFFLQFVTVIVLMFINGIQESVLKNFSGLLGFDPYLMVVLVLVISSLSFAVPAKMGSSLRMLFEK